MHFKAKHTIIYCTILLFFLFFVGCSNITLLRVEELKQVQAHVDSLKLEITLLQEKLLKEQHKQEEMLRLIRADQQIRFSELERNISVLAGNILESQARLSKIDKKTYEIKKKWEEKARSDSLTEAIKRDETENLFEAALNDFTAGRYEISLRGFQDLINKFPDSPRSEEAHYWLAECYYVQAIYNKAADKYKNYIKKYGDGSKVCVALYKLGLAYKNMDQKKAHKMVWTKLINRCPQSEEADAARAGM